MLFAEMTASRWLKQRGSSSKGNSTDLRAPFTVIWLHIPFPQMRPFSALQSQAHIRSADNMMKSIWSHVPRASSSIRFSLANYSSFFFFWCRCCPHVSLSTWIRLIANAVHINICRVKRWTTKDIFKKDHMMHAGGIGTGKTESVRRSPQDECSFKPS